MSIGIRGGGRLRFGLSVKKWRMPDRYDGINNKPKDARNKRLGNASRMVGQNEIDHRDTDSRQEQ